LWHSAHVWQLLLTTRIDQSLATTDTTTPPHNIHSINLPHGNPHETPRWLKVLITKTRMTVDWERKHLLKVTFLLQVA